MKGSIKITQVLLLIVIIHLSSTIKFDWFEWVVIGVVAFDVITEMIIDAIAFFRKRKLKHKFGNL